MTFLTKCTLFFFLGEMGGFEDGYRWKRMVWFNGDIFFRGDVEELFSPSPIFITLRIKHPCIVC